MSDTSTPVASTSPWLVVTGAAQDIALLVWKRAVPPRAELEVAGSADVLKRFLATDYIPDPRTTPAH